MVLQVVGRIALVDTNGGLVALAKYNTHPFLRERFIALGGVIYEQKRRTPEGGWVYQETYRQAQPDTPFLMDLEYAQPVNKPPTWDTVDQLFQDLRKMSDTVPLSRIVEIEQVIANVRALEADAVAAVSVPPVPDDIVEELNRG